MRHFAYVDQNNKILGWYEDSSFYVEDIPKPNIEVTEQVKNIAIDNGHNFISADGSYTERKSLVSDEDKLIYDQISKNNESRKYLRETDWYVVRQLETGKAIPSDISTKRQEARDSIIEVEEPIVNNELSDIRVISKIERDKQNNS